MKKIILLLFTTAILSGCKGNGERVQPTQSTDDFQVEFLFEVDGVKVYRFYDAGNHVYFTNANGKCGYTKERVVSTGKSTMIISTDVETMCNAE